MKHAKLISVVVLLLLVVIVVLQNTESVQTKILFITITMPRAILLIATAAVGFLAGLIAAIRIGMDNKKKKT